MSLKSPISKFQTNWSLISSILSLLISLVALGTTIINTSITGKTLEYSIQKDMMVHTPAIKEYADSLRINYFMNNDDAELQSLSMTFPSLIDKDNIIISDRNINISKSLLENKVRSYMSNRIFNIKDSTYIVGKICIPVMFDYSAIVYGFPQNLREMRLLIFELLHHEDKMDLTYSHSFLVKRYGYPIKKQIYIFSLASPTKVFEQDKKDVLQLLDNQLEVMESNNQFFTKYGYIKSKSSL